MDTISQSTEWADLHKDQKTVSVFIHLFVHYAPQI